MKDRFTLVLAAALALTCGVLGTMLFSSTQAEAQTAHRWSRCFAADLDGVADGDNQGEMANGHGGIRIPQGWTPIGGAVGNRAIVFLCR